MTGLVEIDALALRIGDTPILHDVRLHLQPGQIYGLLGPNGAGKSTTIAAMVGLLSRQSGTLRVLGHDPDGEADAVRARVGVLPEQNGFYDWMTAERYLAFFAGLHGSRLSKAEIDDRMAAVGLAPRPNQTIGTYSRGMRQRLGLARVLIGQPALLILDEPTEGLDPRGRRDLHDLLLQLSAEHDMGILLCTHLLDDVERLCDRVGILVAGRTVAEGAISELTVVANRQARFRVRVREAAGLQALACPAVTVLGCEGGWCVVQLDGSVTPDQAWRALLFGGWPITEIRPEGGGLEDLYFALTQKEMT
jgi:ABC-2 type transport system ATP-binding protein